MTKTDLDALIHEGLRVMSSSRPTARAAPTTPRWSLVASADGAPAHLYLYDHIGWPGIEARDVVEQVRAHARRPLHVHLNSPGGDVFDGLAIFNTLQQHSAPVDIRVEGLAASIASLIAMSGSSLRMARASLFMVHEPHALVIGRSHEMRAMATVLDKASSVMAEIYAKRGANRDTVRAWMHEEKWFKPDEALDAGLIDAIDDDPIPAEALAARAAFDLSGFRHPPGASPLPDLPVSPPLPPRARERARLLAETFDFLLGAKPAA